MRRTSFDPPDKVAYARELVSQLQKADADLGNKYLTSLAGLLKPNLQEKFLGGPMPDPIPIGVSLAAVAALDENRKNKLGNSQNEEEYSPDEEAEYEINNGENYSGDGWGDDSTDYGEHGFDSQDLAQAAEDKKDENPASWQDEFSRHQANGEFEQSPSNNPSEAFNRTLFPDHAENSLRDEFDRSILNQDFEEQRQEREKTGFRYGQTLALKKDKLIGDTSPLRKIPTLTKENQKIRDDLKMITTIGRISGRDVAATLGLHYLTGNGEPVELADLEKLRGYRPVRDGEARVERFIEGTLSGKNTPRIKEPLKKNIEAFAKSDQKEMHVKDKFEGSFLFSPNLGSGQRDIPIALSDMANAIGSGTIEGVTDITLTRKGNTIEIDGQVEYRLRDRYDFAKGKGTEDERLPQGWLALNPNLRRSHIQKLEDAGGVMPFDVTSTPWRKTISGVLNVDNNGDIIKSGGQITKFQWRDIN
jgi:hypothetical protein